MNLNTEVWGDSSTWRQEQYLPASEGTGYSILKATKPRIATFSSNNGTLAAGNTAGKTPINQSLDATICPCGQDSRISPFAKIRMFKNHNSAAANAIPDQTITNDAVCNWFLYEGNGGYYYDWNTNHFNESGGGFRWLPSANINNNLNSSIVPYVYWMTKSLLLDVRLIYIESYSSGIPNYNEMRLADWVAHPTRKVADIILQFKGIDSASLSGYSYKTGTAANLINSAWGGVAYIGKLYNDIEHYAMFTQSTQLGSTILGHCVGSAYASSAMFVMNSADMFDGAVIKGGYRSGDTQGGWAVWWEIPYSEANANKVLSIASLFGCPFTPYNKNTFNIDFTDNELYLPIIDDAGIAHGEYTHGTANATNPFNSKDSVRDYDYNPSSPVDPNTYSSQTYFNPILNLSSMCKRYVLNDAAVEQLCRDLWKISDDLIHTDPNEDFKDYDQLMLDNFLVNSPIDVIVSLDKYPISDIPTGTNSEAIKYGKATGAALGKPLTTNTIFFNFEGVRIYPKFGDCFLDYSPYTCYELYIPFCGMIQIDPGDIMGHVLSVQMVMDLSTGAVTAYIMSDNLCIETANGMAALNIPVSGIDSVTLNSQINNALISAKSAQMQARSSGTLTGRIAGGLKSIKDSLNAKTATMQRASDTWSANLADYDLTHMPITPHKIGSASAACSWSLELTCRLMIYYPEGDAIDSSGGISTTSPKLADLTMYGHTTGFAVISSGVVSDYHGFTVGNIDTSSISGATEAEREMIKALFSQGVYLP